MIIININRLLNLYIAYIDIDVDRILTLFHTVGFSIYVRVRVPFNIPPVYLNKYIFNYIFYSISFD